ncbi:MAG: YigZ family protein [Desulfobacteraceae bacterium]|nr:YigZ family protein [Desulfobacteraceae bacterium]
MGKDKQAAFYTIADKQKAEIKIKRSTFICSLKSVKTIETAKEFISGTSKANKTANHNCWAYIVGEIGQIFHCSDAGEPAGTAGKPMLNTLQRHDMTQIAAVVTRYFGGVKLGIRGLIDAYAESVELALAQKPLIKLVHIKMFQIMVPYSFNDTLVNHLKKYQAGIERTDYSDQIRHECAVEKESWEDVEMLLANFQKQGLLIYEVRKPD